MTPSGFSSARQCFAAIAEATSYALARMSGFELAVSNFFIRPNPY